MVTGSRPERSRTLRESLVARELEVDAFPVAGEPSIEVVRKGIEQARAARSDVVLGVGGGSVVDAAKAIAALLTNEGDLLDYLEIIGRGKLLTRPAAPCITVPTTAGAGSEVTRNAVLTSPERQVKVSLRSQLMLPRLAWIDPELSSTMPPDLTAATGVDALSQLIEAYVSHTANPMTDGLCREGLSRAARSLPRAYEHGEDMEARTDMALASLMSGIALANAKLGAVHGFAGPFGGMFCAQHGAVCAALLVPVMKMNTRALRERAPESPALQRYADVARTLTQQPKATAEDGIGWIERLCRQFHIPGLSTYGVKESHFPQLVEKAAAASSMKGNPIELEKAELCSILEQAV
jgi:alcohol dehydrogenase class IV